MPKLTLTQQRALARNLTGQQRMRVKSHCQRCEMSGQGISDIIKSVKKVLGPIATNFSVKVLKEIVIPFIKRKIKTKQAGKGLRTAGSGLRLAGQRGRK